VQDHIAWHSPIGLSSSYLLISYSLSDIEIALIALDLTFIYIRPTVTRPQNSGGFMGVEGNVVRWFTTITGGNFDWSTYKTRKYYWVGISTTPSLRWIRGLTIALLSRWRLPNTFLGGAVKSYALLLASLQDELLLILKQADITIVSPLPVFILLTGFNNN